MDKTPTVRHLQGGTVMVAAGYRSINIATVKGVVFYGSRDTTEYGGFLLVTFKLLTSSSYFDRTKVQGSMRTESSIISKHTIDKIWKDQISCRICYNNMQKKRLCQGNKRCRA